MCLCMRVLFFGFNIYIYICMYIYTYILKWTRWNKYALLGEESVWGQKLLGLNFSGLFGCVV